MGSIGAMLNKYKSSVSKALIGDVALCFVIGFALDSVHSNAPQSPDPSVGRTIPHDIKWHGEVFLTPSEDAPYQWTKVVAASAIALIVLLKVAGFAISRQNKPSE
jgi:hypothetical protein